jgi:kumamolisin
VTPPRRTRLVTLPGSSLVAPRGARRERVPRSAAPLTITLHLRRSRAEALEQLFEDVAAGRRPPLRHEAFVAQFGAVRGDIAAVRRFAAAHRFRVSHWDAAKRIVRLSGPAAGLASAFGVNRVRYRLGDVVWNSFRGHIHLPAELAESVVGVFGFDDRPALRRLRPRAMSSDGGKTQVSYSVPEVAALYHFPDELDGAGQTVGIIALGGGYLTRDLRAYFHALRQPMPRIQARSVDGARNAPRGRTAQFDGEVTGDLETVSALAPRARIAVYFAPNSPRGFFEAVAAAVHDRRQRNTVLSISWGMAEPHWRRSSLIAFNQVLQEAAVLGITVCVSSGDHGPFADANDRRAHVNFPASSPYVLACGGTTLVGARGRIRSECVWHNHTGASGGGVSAIFPQPSWQRGIRAPRTASGSLGRGVPDVAANADPLTGYRIFGHGHWHVGAGTSAAAPLWAGLVARLNQRAGTAIGLPTPFLYRHFAALVRAGAVVPVTKGNNGLFRARKGWSCCTGIGTPRGARLARAFAGRGGKFEQMAPRHGPRTGVT